MDWTVVNALLLVVLTSSVHCTTSDRNPIIDAQEQRGTKFQVRPGEIPILNARQLHLRRMERDLPICPNYVTPSYPQRRCRPRTQPRRNGAPGRLLNRNRPQHPKPKAKLHGRGGKIHSGNGRHAGSHGGHGHAHGGSHGGHGHAHGGSHGGHGHAHGGSHGGHGHAHGGSHGHGGHGGGHGGRG